jgi:hypothetical protein
MRARGGATVASRRDALARGHGRSRPPPGSGQCARGRLAVDLIPAAGVPSRSSGARSARWSAGRARGRPCEESLERLWALGLFADILVERSMPRRASGCAYHLTLRPLVRRIAWQGDAGSTSSQLVAAASGARRSVPGTARARREDLLALYRREGYLDARVEVETVPVPESRAGRHRHPSAGIPVRSSRSVSKGRSGCPRRP